MKHNRFFSLVLLLFGLFFLTPQTKVSATASNTEKAGLQRPVLITTEESFSSEEYSCKKRSSYYSSKWESYGSYYYYNQMSSAEKALYDRLNAVCIDYIESTSDALSTYYKQEKIHLTSFCSTQGLTTDEAYQTAMIFYYSNPQYYFLSPSFYLSTSGNTNYISIRVYDAFANGAARKKATASMQAKITSYVTAIKKESSLLAREKKAHDLIVQNVVYQANDYDQSAYSAFLTGKTVCAGYAAAFSILCNAVGIDSTIVTSYDHAWNYVRLNDSWYYVDCTWDDTDDNLPGRDCIYTYFNRSRSKFLEVSGDQSSHHKEESFWSSYSANCTLDSGATMNSVGTLPSITKKTSAPKVTITKKDGYNTVTIQAPSSSSILYYTIDGTAPSAARTKSYRYHSSFNVAKSGKIQVVAVTDTCYDSATTTVSQTVAFNSAATPSITTQPSSASYAYHTSAKALTVKASVTDGGTLSYQWYQNSKASTSGATAIKNATSSSYQPPTTSLGTRYYYCVVTNTNKNANITKTVRKTTKVAKVVTTKRAISKVKVTGLSTREYNGKKQTPSPAIKWGSSSLRKGTDYTLSYSNNKKIGTAVLTITGKGMYSGTKKVNFSIVPKKTSITKLKAQSKGFSVHWKKNNTVTGYKIQYSTKKNFTSSKTLTIKKASASSASVRKLKSKKVYYVRIRCYKIVQGKTYYSSWSKSLKIKTK